MEVLIATALLATSLAALAELFVVSVKNNAVARHDTITTALAAQKLEQLRIDTGVVPSAVNTLQVNTSGYVDYLDQNGVRLDTAAAAIPDGTAYIRRWSIEPIPASAALVLQVLVTRRRTRGAADEGSVARAPEEARVITVMRRAQ